MKELFVTKPSLPPLEEYIGKMEKIWKSGVLTNCGPLHNEFERKLCELTGCGDIKLFTNGHTALEYALGLIRPEDKEKKPEVITTPFTFVSTVNAIERAGFRPVFCDVSRDGLTIDVSKIEEKITDDTAAIMPVHVYGNMCGTDKIEKIAKKHGLYVIYDGAHAFGEKCGEEDAACFGDMTVFSFHATKAFGSAEGGAIAFNGPKACEFAAKAAEMRNFGLKDGDCEEPGGNGKMNELCAAMGLCNLEHFNEYVSARKKISEVYGKLLASNGTIQSAMSDANGLTKRNYAYYPVIFKSEEELLKVMNVLEENKVHTRRYFYPAVNNMKYYAEKYGECETNVSDDVSKRVLCLPMSSEMTEEDAEAVGKIILSAI